MTDNDGDPKENKGPMPTINQAAGQILINLTEKTSLALGDLAGSWATVFSARMSPKQEQNIKEIAARSENLQNHTTIDLTPIKFGALVQWTDAVKDIDPNETPLTSEAHSQALDALLEDNFEIMRGIQGLTERDFGELKNLTELTRSCVERLVSAGLAEVAEPDDFRTEINIHGTATATASISALIPALAILYILAPSIERDSFSTVEFAILGGGIAVVFWWVKKTYSATSSFLEKRTRGPLDRSNFFHRKLKAPNRRAFITVRGRYVLHTLFPEQLKSVFVPISEESDP